MPPEPLQRVSGSSTGQAVSGLGGSSGRRPINSSSFANSQMKPTGSSSYLTSTTSISSAMNNDFLDAPPTVPSTPARPPLPQRSNPASMGMGYNPYMMGGMGMGGMGMGMGMGGMGYGGYGMPYGNPLASIFMGPMQIVYSINYFIMCLGQVGDLLGMSSTALTQLSQQLLHYAKQFEIFLRKSTFRRWLQRKSKKSALFRWVCVLVSMCLSFHLSKLLQHVLRQYLGGKKSITTAPSSAVIAQPRTSTVLPSDVASSVLNSVP